MTPRRIGCSAVQGSFVPFAQGWRSGPGAGHLPGKTAVSVPLSGYNITDVLSKSNLTGTEQLSCFVPRSSSAAPSRIRR